MKNPIDNLTYDWITILHAKAKGVNAYEKYLRDAREADATDCIELLEQLYEDDCIALEKIREHVSDMFAGDFSEEVQI